MKDLLLIKKQNLIVDDSTWYDISIKVDNPSRF